MPSKHILTRHLYKTYGEQPGEAANDGIEYVHAGVRSQGPVDQVSGGQQEQPRAEHSPQDVQQAVGQASVALAPDSPALK